MTRELQFVLCCARVRVEAARVRAIAAAGIDWEAVIGLAGRHGVRPLVFRGARAACGEALPGEVRAEMLRVERALAAGNLLAAGELLRVSGVFAERGIPLAAMKGPVLGQMAYGDFALREFADLDLLVRAEDFVRASGLLEEAGYQAGWAIDARLKAEFLRYQGESWFTSARGGPTIDLHFRVAAENSAMRLEARHYWPRFRPVDIAGRAVETFAPEDLVLYLAAQGGHDQWFDLRRLCDLTELLRRHPDLDWAAVLEAARRVHGGRNVLVGLELAGMLLEAPVPEAARREIAQDEAVGLLARRAAEQLVQGEAPGDLQRMWFQVRVQERWRDRVRVAWGLLTDRTDSDGQWWLLPRALWGLYPVLRPVRMVGKVIRG